MAEEEKKEEEKTDGDGWVKQEGSSFWNPIDEGETLIGEVVEIVEGDYGSQYELNIDGKDDTSQLQAIKCYRTD